MWSFSKLLPIAILAMTSGAFAGEPSPADVQAAKNDFVEATELREKGNLERALAFFRSAFSA